MQEPWRSLIAFIIVIAVLYVFLRALDLGT